MSKTCLFSEKAKELIATTFPELSKENPLFNIKVNVSIVLDDFFEKSKVEPPVVVHLQRVEDMLKEMVKAAEFVGDMWIEDELPNRDEVGIADLLGAEVSVVDSDQVFFVSFQLKTKAVKSGV